MTQKATFYDLDGTLLSCNVVTTYAYYARNDDLVDGTADRVGTHLVAPSLSNMSRPCVS